MKKGDLISGLILTALALWLLLYGIPKHTGAGIGYGLSPSGLPCLMAGGLLVLALIQVINSAVSMARMSKTAPAMCGYDDVETIDFLSHGKFLGTVLLLFVLTLLAMHYLGFVTGAVLFMLTFQYLAGQRNFLLLGVLAVIVPLVLRLIFWQGMSILLPEGVLF